MGKKIILVSGYPAAGKSTFARKLAEKLNIPCFTKDTIKESMADGFGKDSVEILKKGSAATFNTMLHIAECFLQVGNICILESNFMIPEGERLQALSEKYNVKCLTYVFSGDFDVLYDRYAHRKALGERHWVHKDPGERDSFKDALVKYKIGQLDIGTVIPVDATDFSRINFDELIADAKQFIRDTEKGAENDGKLHRNKRKNN